MAIDLSDEILQDFLVEAGEILELLGEQLVELEQSPGDYDLLNAIFRGFHTIKGGAGFLNLTAMVSICHLAEDVFNVLRQGDRSVNSSLMDVILKVHDVVNAMFEDVRSGQDPEPADPSLIEQLKPFSVPETDDEKNSSEGATEGSVQQDEQAEDISVELHAEPDGHIEAEITSHSDSDEITEAEFDALLDSIHAQGTETSDSVAINSGQAAGSDEITEDEFEALLDQLHGAGPIKAVDTNETVDVDSEQHTAAASSVTTQRDEITEDEFEALLDELHGEGKHTNVVPVTSSANPSSEKDTEHLAKVSTQSSSTDSASLDSPDHIEKKVVAEPVVSSSNMASLKNAAPTNTKLAETIEPSKAQNKAAPPAETTVRVDTHRLDQIMNMVGELVLVRNRFETLKTTFHDEQMIKAVANLDVVTSDLQLAVMKTRMQPIKKVFGRFPRLVRDLARNLKKEVQLKLEGEETDLDKNLVEALADPLIHLVRNSVDHGIEMPAERIAAGKASEGTVILSASQEGDHISLTIEDDGKGMDAEVLKDKAIEKGIIDSDTAARLTDKECFNLIFMPGFSTKSEISDISGRGVGMDVVKTRIAQMNGTVEINSTKGKGSKIAINVPLTLAIMPTLMVKLQQQTFALPLTNVVEILDLDLKRVNVVDGQTVVVVRKRALPLFYLKKWLIPGSCFDQELPKRGHVVVVNSGGQQIGFVVDHLVGQEEVVIKALGAKLQGLPGLAGATITGDGMIALILDIPGLMKKYAA